MSKYYFKAAAETTSIIKLRIKIIIFSKLLYWLHT